MKIKLITALFLVSAWIFAENPLPPGWRDACKAKSRGTYCSDSSVKLGSSASLRMEAGKAGKAVVLEKVFRMPPGSMAVISFFSRGENIVTQKQDSPPNYYGTIVRAQDSNGIYLGAASPKGSWKTMYGTFDWRKTQFTVKTPADGKIFVHLRLIADQGIAWYDRVDVRALSPVGKKAEHLKSQLFPVDFQNGEYALSTDVPGMFFLDLKGHGPLYRKKIVRMEWELPPFLVLLGAEHAKPEFGKDAVRYRPAEIRNHSILLPVAMTAQLRTDRFAWRNFLRIYLKAKPEGISRKAQVRYRMLVDGKSGSWKQFQISVLPPMKPAKRKTKSFSVTIMEPISQASAYPEVRESYAAYWNSLAERVEASLPQWFERYPEQEKAAYLKHFNPFYFMAAGKSTPLLRTTPDIGGKTWRGRKIPPLIDAAGKPKSHGGKAEIAPWYLIEDPDGIFWDELFPAEIRRLASSVPEVKEIVWDFEPGTDHGYDAVNRARFAKQLGLREVPDLAAIRSRHTAAWAKFRMEQNHQIIRRFSAALRKHFPGLKFLLCTDNLSHGKAPVSAWCAVDIRQIDDAVDGYRNMPYYTGEPFYLDVAFNLKSVRKPQVFLIDPSEMLIRYFLRYTPQTVVQNIIAAAFLNSGGLAFWQYDCFDARYLQAIRKAYGALAEVEDISRNGVSADGELTCRAENVTRVEWEENGRKSSFIHPDFSNRKALLKKKNGEYALMLLNYHRERNLILRISISGMPPGRYQVADVMEQIAYPDADPGKGFLVKLSPDGAALLRISRKGREQYAGRVSQQELQAELIREEHLNKTDNYSERIENKDGSIRWTMPPEFSKPVLAMECGKSRIHLSPETGTVCGWFPASAGDLLAWHDTRGVLGEIRLNDIRQSLEPFSVVSKRLKDGAGEIELQSAVGAFAGANPEENPLEGLQISSRIQLPATGNELRFAITLTNRSPHGKPMVVDWRFFMNTCLGSAFSGLTPPKKITRFFSGNELLPESSWMLLRKGWKAPFAEHGRRDLVWDGAIPSQVAGIKNISETLILKLPESAYGVYSWQNDAMATWEPLFRTTLSAGQSKTFPITLIFHKGAKNR